MSSYDVFVIITEEKYFQIAIKLVEQIKKSIFGLESFNVQTLSKFKQVFSQTIKILDSGERKVIWVCDYYSVCNKDFIDKVCESPYKFRWLGYFPFIKVVPPPEVGYHDDFSDGIEHGYYNVQHLFKHIYNIQNVSANNERDSLDQLVFWIKYNHQSPRLDFQNQLKESIYRYTIIEPENQFDNILNSISSFFIDLFYLLRRKLQRN